MSTFRYLKQLANELPQPADVSSVPASTIVVVNLVLWSSDKFIKQIKKAIKIADIKYPRREGWRVVWVFDHSSCHAAMADDDSLDVSKMNVKCWRETRG